MNKHILVIGGGVIGLSTAYALIKAGQTVTLIEQEADIAQQTSFANAGQLSYRYVAPLADAGVPLQGLRWMLKNNSPLNLKIQPSIHQWLWLLQFLLASTRKTNRINSENILCLSLLSQKVMEDWRTNDDIGDFAWDKSGKLIIHRDTKSLKIATETIDEQFQKVLNVKQIIELDQSLSYVAKDLVGAIYAPTEETADCYLFAQQLFNYLKQQKNFNYLLMHQVKKINATGRKIQSISTNQRELKNFDDIIICSGNGSREILTPLGIKVPLLGLKGYSLNLPYPQEDNIAPKLSVTDFAKKTVYAKIGHHLRIAAMVDIGYDKDGVRAKRVDAIKTLTRATFPYLKGINDAEIWYGLRPSTPQGPAIIGATTYKNLWLNIGHGSLGFTLAAGSATILTDLILQGSSPIV